MAPGAAGSRRRWPAAAAAARGSEDCYYEGYARRARMRIAASSRQAIRERGSR